MLEEELTNDAFIEAAACLQPFDHALSFCSASSAQKSHELAQKPSRVVVVADVLEGGTLLGRTLLRLVFVV